MNSLQILPPRPEDDPRDHVVVVCVKRYGFSKPENKWEMRTTAMTLSRLISSSDAEVRTLEPKGMDPAARAVYWFTFHELVSKLTFDRIFPFGDDEASDRFNHPELYPEPHKLNPNDFLSSS